MRSWCVPLTVVLYPRSSSPLRSTPPPPSPPRCHNDLSLQVDVDELWSADAIVAAYKVLAGNGGGGGGDGDATRDGGGDGDATRDGGGDGDGGDTGGGQSGPKCVRTHCHFFVGPGVVTTTRDGYGHSDRYEWTRAWRFEPTDLFVSHAPPVLAHFQPTSTPGVGGDGGGTWELYGRPASDEVALSEAAVASGCVMPDEAAR